MLNLLAEVAAETETIGGNVLKALNVFWKGMLAIAVVIALIIAVTAIMNAVDGKAQKKKAEKAARKEEETSDKDKNS